MFKVLDGRGTEAGCLVGLPCFSHLIPKEKIQSEQRARESLECSGVCVEKVLLFLFSAIELSL